MYLSEFAQKCKEITKFFHNHNYWKAKLKIALTLAKIAGLCQPSMTRWGSYMDCFRSLYRADTVMKSIVFKHKFITGGKPKQHAQSVKIKEIFMQEDYVANLKKSIEILAPIKAYLNYFQLDALPIL